MPNPLVTLDCNTITDWASFHEAFQSVFGFPAYYGKNMNAWIDCMTYLDDADAGMTHVHCSEGGTLTLQLENTRDFKARCPDQYEAILECAGFVNGRRIDRGEEAVLTLSLRP